ncbi:MAG: helicase HerA-like domain-containing protein [Pseudomonadota bacterium]
MNELKQFAIGGAEGILVEHLCKMSNRHGLIAGATGTGKTVTLQILAEGFSRLGVPVFTADIKGDLSGLCSAGSPHPKIDERLLKIPLKGRPLPVQRTLIRPPESRIGPVSEEDRQDRIERSPLKGRYDIAVNRESAYEILQDRAKEMQVQQDEAERKKMKERTKAASGGRRQGTGEAFIKSTARAIGSQIGRQIIRGIMGSFFGGRR